MRALDAAACLGVVLGSLWSPPGHAAPGPQLERIYEGQIGPHPAVARLLVLPSGDVSGDYYVKAHRIALISVLGKKNGDALTLQAGERPGSEEGGRFDCTMRGHGIEGKWLSRDGQKEYRVALIEIRSKKERTKLRNAILAASDERLLPSPECAQASTEGPDESGCGPLQCAIIYELKNDWIRSFAVWSSMPCGANPNVEQRYVTYNAQTSEEIVLQHEIDPTHQAAFEAFVRDEGRKKLIAWRTRASDEDWYNLLLGAGAETRGNSADAALKRRAYVDELFARLDPLEILTEFHVARDGTHLGRCGLWGFPHVAAALDFCDELIISPQQMARYLKPTSVLRKLTTSH